MALTSINPSVALVKAPTLYGAGTFNYSTTSLPEYQGLAVPAGSSIQGELGTISDLPIIPTGVLGSILSLNVYLETTADGTAADTWKLHMRPVWLAPTDPTSDLTIFSFMLFSTVDNANLIETRTHPATTAKISTLLNMQARGSATITSGTGSEVTNPEPARWITAAQYVQLDLVASGTDTITINTLRVWGTFRKKN